MWKRDRVEFHTVEPALLPHKRDASLHDGTLLASCALSVEVSQPQVDNPAEDDSTATVDSPL